MAAEAVQRQLDIPPFSLEGFPTSLKNVARIELDEILNKTENFQDRVFVKGLVIDPEGSRDRDDAIWVTKEVDGTHIIDVSIADVAEYIKEGKALDAIARLKGFSQYNEDDGLIDSMFPRELNEERLSLLARKPRLTMTIRMKLSPQLDIEDIDIFPSLMVSPKDLTYKDAARIRYTPQEEFHEMLCVADRLAIRLHTKHAEKDVEELPKRRQKRDTEEKHMHNMVREFMMLANFVVAKFAHEYEIPIIYRNQKVDGNGASNTRAYYSHVSEGHASVNVPFYAHLTSPIRRYPDVFAWRMIKQFLSRNEIHKPTAKRAGRVARRINQTAMAMHLSEAS